MPFFFGNRQVSVIGTEILARAFQATAVSPVAVPAWGIPPAAQSTSSVCRHDTAGNASSASLALYDYRREAAEVRGVIIAWAFIVAWFVF